MKKVDEILKELRDALQETENPHCALVSIHITSRGIEVERQLISPGGLKRDGKSMRNLKGEWIK